MYCEYVNVKGMRYKIDKNIAPPRRGPRKKIGELPLALLEVGDSIKIIECEKTRRPSVYNSVKDAIKTTVTRGKLKGEFKASTIKIDDDFCEVRVFRLR